MSNRLAQSNSPYLLQHADNPVDWYPWGPEALQMAREEDKPIFLSIGYAACHWCHVMEHESFEDAATAEYMNEHFVSIKVDREERPDVDSIYMDAVVALTGQGGWPMSVFLTPQGEPFFGGTYFPPERRHGMPSFLEVLQHVRRIWEEQRDQAREAGSDLVSRLSQPDAAPAEGEWNPDDLNKAAEALHSSFDWANGGWGGAPKFPQASAIEFLLVRFARHGDKLARDIAVRSLEAMAAGGIFDQLGGGFARYSVDTRWAVPHFEKMLYDNALLVPAYLRAWQITEKEHLLSTAEATLEFLRRELRDPAGGFYSSIDADSEGEEGKFYVWTQDQIARVLADGELSELFTAAYGVTAAGNFEGANVLHRAAGDDGLAERSGLSVDEVKARLDTARELLLAARSERVRPETDDKVLTAWNGFMLTALAEHARVTGSRSSLAEAQSLAAFLLDEMYLDGRLLRSWRRGQAGIDAFLEDHAALGMGLLDLYAVDFQPRWFEAALLLAGEILESFTDPGGGFFDTRADGEQLVRRPKSVQDSPTPSGSSMATRLLMRVDTLHGHDRAREAAEGALAGWSDTASRHPTAFAGWLIAADYSLERRLQLAIVGDPSQGEFQELARIAQHRYLPGLVLAGGRPSAKNQPRLLAGRDLKDGLPTAYLCENFSCQLPTNKPSELTRQLSEAL